MNELFLLDTCCVIWMSQKEWLAAGAFDAISESKVSGCPVFVSSATAWEMAMLVAKGRIRETKGAKRWYDEFLRDGGFAEQPVTTDLFIEACSLPGPIHKDPIDRILIATAREHDLTIVTRDRAILTYGALGHVRVLEC
jgi:PIN domain nuclease of toxin-antitoxin system